MRYFLNIVRHYVSSLLHSKKEYEFITSRLLMMMIAWLSFLVYRTGAMAASSSPSKQGTDALLAAFATTSFYTGASKVRFVLLFISGAEANLSRY